MTVLIKSLARQFQVGSKNIGKIAKTFWTIESTLMGCHQYWLRLSGISYRLRYRVKKLSCCGICLFKCPAVWILGQKISNLQNFISTKIWNPRLLINA